MELISSGFCFICDMTETNLQLLLMEHEGLVVILPIETERNIFHYLMLILYTADSWGHNTAIFNTLRYANMCK